MIRRVAVMTLLVPMALPALLPAMAAAESATPVVRIETTAGTIDLALYPDKAPRTVANFLRLIEDGFYDGLVFHRVVANFVIQAGGFDAGLGYREPPATVANESFNGLANVAGTVAMARQDHPDSADAQFFINVNDNGHLDAQPGLPGYTVFGRVIDGMDVVHEIELGDTHIRAGMAAVPEEPVVIQRAVRVQ